MLSICGADCCNECSKREACGGCRKVDGHPLGGIEGNQSVLSM